jgi:hypothetical protein
MKTLWLPLLLMYVYALEPWLYALLTATSWNFMGMRHSRKISTRFAMRSMAAALCPLRLQAEFNEDHLCICFFLIYFIDFSVDGFESESIPQANAPSFKSPPSFVSTARTTGACCSELNNLSEHHYIQPIGARTTTINHKSVSDSRTWWEQIRWQWRCAFNIKEATHGWRSR